MEHAKQQRIWDEEHARPNVLLQMDADTPSSGVTKFKEFLTKKGIDSGKGLEMACGKGRNVLWLAEQGFAMDGFDFSPAAIDEANRRKQVAGIENAAFTIADATIAWPYESDTFDFAIDCFATTDIESDEGRTNAVNEFKRVLKPDGYLLAYLLSTDDEFHAEMLRTSPSEEDAHAFHHPTGKFEKVFDEEEIRQIYGDFTIEAMERVNKMATFNGKPYACKHFWVVLQK